MTNMKLGDGDHTVVSLLAYEGDEVLICTRNGFMSRYPLALLPATAPKSKGVKAMNLVQDVIVDAAIYHGDASQLLVISDQGAMKRIKLSDIDITGRPVKGNMICKKVKSKPYQIRYIEVGEMNTEVVIAEEVYRRIAMKDITLMSKEATFSQPWGTLANFYLILPLTTAKMIELHQEEDKPVEFEEFNLDL